MTSSGWSWNDDFEVDETAFGIGLREETFEPVVVTLVPAHLLVLGFAVAPATLLGVERPVESPVPTGHTLHIDPI